MSLILDALKKSDRERRVAAGEPFATSAPAQARRFNLGFWLLAALALVAIATVWWMQNHNWPWQAANGTTGTADSPVAATPPQIAEPELPQGAPITPPASGADDSTAANRGTAALPAATVNQPAADASAMVQTPQPQLPDTVDKQLGNQQTPSGADQAAAKMAKRRNRAANGNRRGNGKKQQQQADPPPREFYELPMDIRMQVPALVINVHVFAPEPAERFVLINMQRIEEGEELDGLVAREIRPDGVLMEFQGHEFLLRRP